MKLENTIPYLLHGVSICTTDVGRSSINLVRELTLYTNDAKSIPLAIVCSSDKHKLILRPLSDLYDTDDFNFIFDKETDAEYIEHWIDLDVEARKCVKFSLFFWKQLYEHHFDIDDLIDQGLAIAKNNLKE
jgi:hypothetical protein